MISRMFSDRLNFLKTESAFKVLNKANRLEKKGMDIIHLEIGEPDYQTDPNIISGAIKAMNRGETKYCSPKGIEELRKHISKYVLDKKNIRYDIEEIAVTPGAKPILFFGLLATINPNDEVIIPSPGFPIYESVVRFCGGIPKFVPIIEKEDNYSIDLERLKEAITDNTKALILNSPHNPTGGIITHSELEKIVELVKDREIMIISDEIYSDLYYDDEPVSIASFPEVRKQTLIIDGFSKNFAMTGWRLGYGLMPKELAQKIERLAVNSYSCVPPFVQQAGIAALETGEKSLISRVEQFKARRDLLVEGLREIPGFHCPTPKGAFYAFPNIEATGYSDKELAELLLEEAGVAVLAGSSFGPGGSNCLRFSYANSKENICKAVDRIKKIMTQKKKRKII